MNKVVLASALVATTAFAVTCQVDVQFDDSVPYFDCGNVSIEDPLVDNQSIMTPAEQYFVNITDTAPFAVSAVSTCDQFLADYETCSTALGLQGGVVSDAKQKCVDDLTAGASSACTAPAGTTCTAGTTVCTAGLECLEGTTPGKSTCETPIVKNCVGATPAEGVVCQGYTFENATPTDFVMTPDSQVFVAFTGTSEFVCDDVECVVDGDIVIYPDLSEEQEACVADGAAAGASSACTAPEGATCVVDTTVCTAGLECLETETQGEFTCQTTFDIQCPVSAKTADGTAVGTDCAAQTFTAIVDSTPAIMTDGSFFSTFTSTTAIANCAAISAGCATESKATQAEPSAAQATCLVDGAAAGASAACGVAKGETCSTTIVCATDLMCDATTNKCVETVGYTISGLQETDEAKLKTQLDAVFIATTNSVAQEEACAGTTVVSINKIYPVQQLAFVTMSAAPDADCTDSDAVKSIGTFQATAGSADAACETTCGSTTDCACESGMACTPASEEGVDPVVADNCVEGQVCTKQADESYLCNNSVIASAAFAVAAAVLAVVF